MTRKDFIVLGAIIFLGSIFRLYNLNWDSNFHFHPDERAIILYTLPLQFPQSVFEFFSVQSPWNPHFFAYGSFPLYFLKVCGSLFSFIDNSFIQYDGITLLGRFISALFDIGTIFLLFLLGKKLSDKNIGIIAAFFYAVCVLPIQLSHFYAVDTILTFFIMLMLYKLCKFYDAPNKKSAISIGIIFAFALATKISAFVLLISIVTTICIEFFFLFIYSSHKQKQLKHHIIEFLKKFLIYGILIFITTISSYAILEPYAFIDYSSFLAQSLQQAEMTKSAFTFPYTLQYVGKVSYLYELKNMFLWGLGPIVGICSLIGFFISLQKVYYHFKTLDKKIYIVGSFFIVYFLIVGNFAIGFMRYMLPLYPLFCLLAAVAVKNYLIDKKLFSVSITISVLIFGICLSLIWPLSFISIYSQSSTRIQATDWILRTIPAGKTLAIEHWDDAIPIHNQQRYKIETLELYNPDSPEKWRKIKQQLDNTDYIIIASNRLYTPLQKLTNCKTLPIYFCYKETAVYYTQLFDGSLGYKKIAEFSVYPTIPVLNTSINDQSADESFTVYDHPKIMIFGKI